MPSRRLRLRRNPVLRDLRSAMPRVLNHLAPLSVVAYRATSPEWAGTHVLFDGEGARRHGGRWNPPGQRVAYLSETPESALSEFLAHARGARAPEHMALPAVVAWGRIELGRVLDLTDARIVSLLGVERSRFVGSDWQADNAAGVESLGQSLGRAAAEASIEGLRVPSAAVPGSVNLVIHLDQLSASSKLAPHGLA